MRKPFFWSERKGWYLRIPTTDGRLQTVRLGDTKKSAYDEWDRMKIASSAPTETATAAPTMAKLAALYFTHIRDQAAKSTISEATVTRRINHIAPFLAASGHIAISDLKPHHVTDWLRTQETWNATTCSDAAASVKRILKWATDEGRIESNPLKTLAVKRGRPRDHVISRTEFETLLAGVWKQRFARRKVASFRAVLIALRLSGCRPSEITRLMIEDCRTEAWTIREHKNRKKTYRPRTVYLSPCLQTLTKIASRGRVAGPVFQAESGRAWKYSDMRLRFQRLRKKTKISPKCVLYSFRHTWVTEALTAGVDVATVAEMAGTSIQMIDRHYGHLNQQRKHLSDAALKISVAKYHEPD
jgi:integrase